ncbi:MAG: carboxypeptidase-like regulatory domain-containing protein, partial [Bacteroidetes Order II. Incertae sedis bacterium]|nr:carboxypeptidase-like regulatory domain-containing protein [Bacteroidetes Order II. bacterium]
MRTWQISFLTLLLYTLCTALPVSAQEWGAVSGVVRASDTDYPLPGVSVVVYGTNFGTATDDEGRYSLKLPFGEFTLRFSSIGFEASLDSILVTSGRTTRLDIDLDPATLQFDEITVEGEVQRAAGVFEISTAAVRD